MKRLKSFLVLKVLAVCQCLYFMLSCLVASSCVNKTGSIILTPYDTVVLPYMIERVSSLYMPEYDTQVNTYFCYLGNDTTTPFLYGYCFCVDSITATTLFPFKSQLSDCIPENHKTLLINPSGSNFFLRINANGDTLNRLEYDFGEKDGKKLSLNTYMIGFPLKEVQGERLFYTFLFNPGYKNYLSDTAYRAEYFSQKYASELKISENKIENNNHYFVSYPKILSSTKIHFNYYVPSIAMNRNLDLITCYYYIDSLYVSGQDDTEQQYPFKSDAKLPPFKNYDVTRSGDPSYRKEYSCETSANMFLTYDSYRKYYYVVKAKPMPFENPDGTFNSPTDQPWSLMIIDSAYTKIGEIDMPEQFSKHEIMVTREGIAVKDKTLTKKNGNKPTFVIFTMEEQ